VPRPAATAAPAVAAPRPVGPVPPLANGGRLFGSFATLFAQDGFSRQAHASLSVDIDDLDENLVAFVEDVFDLVDAVFVDL
jgi:hypothetical protein